MSGVLVVPRYLSVLQQGRDVLVGLMPPRAVTIGDAPGYLPGLLAYLSVPRGREEAVAETARRGALAVEQAETLLDELLEAGVLATSDLDSDGRYARHELYYSLLGVDGAEQQRVLANATVGLVGTGGIGTNLATTLVAAGVGTIVFSDGDNVELSNLTRQTLFDESTVGRPKVEVAAERLRALNADVVVRPVRSNLLRRRTARRALRRLQRSDPVG
ncbi:MAG: HesA/MoeB/ThiF family protein [Pseudonocardiaceae bacterium]